MDGRFGIKFLNTIFLELKIDLFYVLLAAQNDKNRGEGPLPLLGKVLRFSFRLDETVFIGDEFIGG